MHMIRRHAPVILAAALWTAAVVALFGDTDSDWLMSFCRLVTGAATCVTVWALLGRQVRELGRRERDLTRLFTSIRHAAGLTGLTDATENEDGTVDLAAERDRRRSVGS